MKAFIIHTPHRKSLEYANACLKSFEQHSGWEPELFEGFIPSTLPEYAHIKIKKMSRAMDYFKTNHRYFIFKKCCSLNHYRLFLECVKINEPIAIIEHDSVCIEDWKDINFKDILVMNAKSSVNEHSPRWRRMKKRPIINHGINDINFGGLIYRHNPSIENAHMMPGTAAYAVTPQGAQKMIAVYQNEGWEQSDFMINTEYVNIQTIIPELFTFGMPNLSMSHGENMS